MTEVHKPPKRYGGGAATGGLSVTIGAGRVTCRPRPGPLMIAPARTVPHLVAAYARGAQVRPCLRVLLRGMGAGWRAFPSQWRCGRLAGTAASQTAL